MEFYKVYRWSSSCFGGIFGFMGFALSLLVVHPLLDFNGYPENFLSESFLNEHPTYIGTIFCTGLLFLTMVITNIIYYFKIKKTVKNFGDEYSKIKNMSRFFLTNAFIWFKLRKEYKEFKMTGKVTTPNNANINN